MTDNNTEAVAWRAKLGYREDLHLCAADPSDEHGWHSVEPLYPASSLASREERIAALTKERDEEAFRVAEYWKPIMRERDDWIVELIRARDANEARALKAEALLEEAVKGLEAIINPGLFGSDDYQETARATLSTITKDQDQ